MNKLEVAVVILNFNGKKLLEKFLPTILKNSQPYTVIIADNGSTDDSILFLNKEFKNVQIIENKKNYGFSEGYNMALKQIDATYYILLNSDVEVNENWIEPLYKLMLENPNVAACQPKILDYNNKQQFEYAGGSGGFIDNYGYPFCRGRIFNSIEKDTLQYEEKQEIFWATGACMILKADAFWEVGAFDEDYFAHMEEIDLCWRLKNRGYKIYIEPKSFVYHIGGGTLNKTSANKTFLNFRNNLITLTKNHPINFLILKLIFRALLDGIAGLKFLIEGHPNHFFAVIKAHFSYYLSLKRTLNKRKKIILMGINLSKKNLYNGNIVFDYFLKSKKKFSDLNKNKFLN